MKSYNNSTFLQFEKEDDEVDNGTKSLTLEIPNHEVQVLIIEEFFDLKDMAKGLDDDDKNSDDSDIDRDNNSNVDSENLNDDSASDDSENEMNSDYNNVEELIQQLDDDLVETLCN